MPIGWPNFEQQDDTGGGHHFNPWQLTVTSAPQLHSKDNPQLHKQYEEVGTLTKGTADAEVIGDGTGVTALELDESELITQGG